MDGLVDGGEIILSVRLIRRVQEAGIDIGKQVGDGNADRELQNPHTWRGIYLPSRDGYFPVKQPSALAVFGVEVMPLN